jgi:hypothetical protein
MSGTIRIGIEFLPLRDRRRSGCSQGLSKGISDLAMTPITLPVSRCLPGVHKGFSKPVCRLGSFPLGQQMTLRAPPAAALPGK